VAALKADTVHFALKHGHAIGLSKDAPTTASLKHPLTRTVAAAE
jgi:hypothetical protein